ncbi:MAG: Na+/H+ antiporter subunit E [Anaerolineae bacterium]|nr:Na+/H+ antiporter subunit E [Anaerolineae bacterium]
MNQVILFAFPMTFVWLALSDEWGVISALLGYAASLGVLMLAGVQRGQPVRLAKLPGGVLALVTYAIRLLIDILLSGVDVARRVLVLAPTPDIAPGIIAIDTQDPADNALIAALSAHAITITPGQMVVDFGQQDENLMYVHCLDVEASRATLARDQSARLKLFRRILGYD